MRMSNIQEILRTTSGAVLLNTILVALSSGIGTEILKLNHVVVTLPVTLASILPSTRPRVRVPMIKVSSCKYE